MSVRSNGETSPQPAGADVVGALLDLAPVVMFAAVARSGGATARDSFFISPNCTRLLGARPAEVGELYELLRDLVHPEDTSRLVAARDATSSQPSVEVQVRLRIPGGAYRWWRIVSEDHRDELDLRVGFLWDVTESVSAAEAENQARADAERSRDQAIAASRAKTEFLSRMSHELRTPLNSIVGFAQLLALQDLRTDEKEWVDHVVRAGRHLLGLIDEVLDVAGIETGRLEFALGPVEVGDLIAETVGLVRPIAVEHAVTIRQHDGSIDGDWVVADRQRLRQILLNLLENGIRYNLREGVVDVRISHGDDVIHVDVIDDGHGIGDELLARVFEPFDRLGVERTGIEGTGMGLALSRSLAERMSGTIEVTSVPSAGSTFRLTLPAASEDGDAPVPGDLAPGEPERPDVTLTVLYIEDNVANLRLMESVMELRPQVVLTTATRGRVGLALAGAHPPDLVMVDLHLPDMGGQEVLRLLRRDEATAALPVAIVSADATQATIDELLELGADHYLTKPIDIHVLIDTVDGLIEQKEARRDRSA